LGAVLEALMGVILGLRCVCECVEVDGGGGLCGGCLKNDRCMSIHTG